MHLLLILPYYLLQQPQKNKIRTLNSSRGYKSWVADTIRGYFGMCLPTMTYLQIDSITVPPFCMYLCRMKTALLLGIDQLGPPLFPPPQHFLFSIVVVQHAYNEIFFGVISSIEVELAYQERDILLSDSFSYYSAPKGRIKYVIYSGQKSTKYNAWKSLSFHEEKKVRS